MKKFIITVLSAGLVFAASNDDINKKLDTLIQSVSQLKQEYKAQEKRIEKLEKALNIQKQELKKQQKEVKQQFEAKSCNKIKVTSLKDAYFGDVIPYYMLDFTLKNEYPKKVVYIEGDLFAEDSDGVTILQDFIKRKVDIPAGAEIKIHKKHLLANDLEKYLKDEDPKKLHIYFQIIKLKFADGTWLECDN